jgi:hypothetical protein
VSVEAISWVWKHSASRLAARLLLLRIANNADENGCNSWHTVPSMARATRLSQRQVTRAARSLETLGEVVVKFNAGPNGSNVYTLIRMGDNLSPPLVTNRSLSGDKSDSAIRKERPRTSKTLNPPTPLFQRGVYKRDVRHIAKAVAQFYRDIMGQDGLRKAEYRECSEDELDHAANAYAAEVLLIPIATVEEVRSACR